MSLAPGTRLGSYEVLALVGAGGMGEVYRARDLKLGRDVALKILTESFAADADRLARCRRSSRAVRSPLPTRSPSRARSRKPSKPRTNPASSTAI